MFSPDDFVSDALGFPAFRVARIESLGNEHFSGNSNCFAYARVDTGDVTTVRNLQNFGFQVIDTNVRLGLALKEGGPELVGLGNNGYQVRESRDEDRVEVEGIARSNFECSRFHLDPGIPDLVADELKAKWAGNFFEGKRGDGMVIVEKESRVVGFTQYFRSERKITIDLIAVEREHQRVGLGSGMIGFIAGSAEGADTIEVGTQISNTKSIRAYEKLGFRVEGSSYVLHYHGPLNI